MTLQALLAGEPGFARLTDRARAVFRHIAQAQDLEADGGLDGSTVFQAFYADANSIPGSLLREQLGESFDPAKLAEKLEHRKFPTSLSIQQWLHLATQLASVDPSAGNGLFVGSEHLFQAALLNRGFVVLLQQLGLTQYRLRAGLMELIDPPASPFKDRYVLVYTHEYGVEVFEFVWAGSEFPTVVLYDDDGHQSLNEKQQSVVDFAGYNFEVELDETIAFAKLDDLPPQRLGELFSRDNS